jgi:1,4-dihydroxy-2-naphthoate octaprenyltransferase
MFVVGLAYPLPPFALIRRGIGEIANAVLGGLLLPMYGFAVVATPTALAWLSVLPFTLLVGCNLLATHWPDVDADRAVGKRTLVVRWSPSRIRGVYGVLVVTSTALAAVLWRSGVYPDPVAIAHAAPLPFLLWGGAVLTRQRSPFPSVLAMVLLAVMSTASWWWVGVGP